MLVPSQTAVQGGHGFGDHNEVENWRGKDWDETQNGAHRVRSVHSRSSLFSVVFGCFYAFDIAYTEIYTWKECKNNKE